MADQSIKSSSDNTPQIDNGDLEAVRESLVQSIDSLLNTNEAPSLDAQISSMRCCLSESEREVLAIEAEIQRTRQYLEQLEAKRQGIHDYIAKQKLVLNPARRIPSEVLYQIFKEYHITPNDWWANPTFCDSLSVRSMHWVLSRVCSQWRTVAFSLASALWSQLHVKLPTGLDGPTMLLGAHIQHSRSNPLSVFIKGAFPSSAPKRHPILTTLFQNAYRLEELRMSMRIDDIQEAFSFFKPLIPSLRILVINHSTSIQRDGTLTDSSNPWVVDSFQSAPQLCSVALIHIYLPHRVLLPWNNLVRLRLVVAGGFWRISHLFGILRSTGNLQHLMVGYHFAHEPELAVSSIITLPSLKTWSIWWITQNTSDQDIHQGGNQLLENLVLPRLQKFYDSISRHGSMDFSRISSLIERSGSLVKTLSCMISETDELLLSSSIGRIGNNLTYLRLKKVGGNFTEAIVVALTCRTNSEVHLAPRLTELHLHGGMEFNATSFMVMVESRKSENGVAPLSHVALDCMGQRAPENLEAFDRFEGDDCFKGVKWSFKL
ncbi:hypothetical protein Moror_9815 [Moniliophthora roreri MCA 2997]|uniref:Uncharacterized protein n=1 Tax=Moniliophthora roreri (strain MCA 2997) TaxID=1381753 RepID=V2Y4H7_MONRO|nr:hypothetical protein Moror_9815 [Moniliophthora roreri MCA 2997]